MEEILRDFSGVVALLVEGVAVLLIAYGAAEAFANSGRHFSATPMTRAGARRCFCASASGCCWDFNSRWRRILSAA